MPSEVHLSICRGSEPDPVFPSVFPSRHEALRRRLLATRLERFIGVIYRPDTELQSHYAQVSLPQQFDAYAWFDETSAVTPLGSQHPTGGVPETWPFGL